MCNMYEPKGALETIGVKLTFLIMVLTVLILFTCIPAMADDLHYYMGYYQPLPSCTQCHAASLPDNHHRKCWTCHNIDYAHYTLKLCEPGSYPPDLDFTTICANYQTVIKEPFSCDDCHVQAGDHTIAHDQTLLPSIDCSQCHVADAPSEHGKYSLSCSTCHNSANAAVKSAIVSGKRGDPVYCADCHGLIDHLTHKNAYLPNADCTGCHLTDLGLRADIINQHAKKNTDCSVCHNSSDPAIKAAIGKGIAGNSVYCADCHREFGNHARMHDQTILTSTACGACHVANAVSEHQGHGPHSIGCLPCHTNADAKILTAIYNGMAGQSVSCGECHLLVGNRFPIANCGPDREAVVGVTTTFSGLASYDHDGAIVSYQWDFGDGTPNESGSSVSHTFTNVGSYQVSLAVIDDQGALDNDTCLIKVTLPVCGCDLVPDGTVVKRGGILGYQITVTNNTDEVQVFKFAAKIKKPDESWYPPSGYLLGPTDVTLDPHASKSKYLTLPIPLGAPYGTYTYGGYVGTAGPPVVKYNECTFTFEVIP
jgi:hypothetical protein